MSILNKVKNILHHYDLYPFQIEKMTGKTAKVFTGNQYVVVKKSKNQNIHYTFPHVYRLASEHQLTSIIPLFVTKQRTLIVPGKSHFYYVMPWVKEKIKEDYPPSYLPLFKEMANIHRKTNVERKMEIQHLEGWVTKQKQRVKNNFHRFERWISSFEAKHFMSPGELLLCYLYAPIREVCKQLEYWYDEWWRAMEETKMIRYSLCHGQLAPSHYLETERGPIILNWEMAHMGEAVKDIAQFYYNICQYSDIKQDNLIENLNTYEQYRSLLQSEYASLAIQILQLNTFIKKVHLFVENRPLHSEVDWVRQFERFQIYINHALYIQNELKNRGLEEELGEG